MSEQYPEGYYWIQVGDCEPEPALIRDGGAFTTGSALPLDLDLIEVLGPVKPSASPLRKALDEIDAFDRVCTDDAYTDTGEAWELIDRVRNHIKESLKTNNTA